MKNYLGLFLFIILIAISPKPKNMNYSYTVENYAGKDVLAIIDKNIGGKSVTNDIENIVRAIMRNGVNVPYNPMIVYRDHNGTWDGYDFKNDQLILLNKSTWQEAVTRYVQIQLTQSNQ